MKIAHISDIHWRGIARHKEYNKTFEVLFKQLKEHKPDLIINCGDTFHTKTQGITPEIIERLAWMFRTLAEIAPSYTILGNHDGNLTNLNRKDIITPIHESIAHPRAHLLRKSGVYKVAELGGKNINLCVYSPFDQKNWSSVKPTEGAINIALYHGSVAGSTMDNNWRMPSEIAETTTADFTQYHFVFMGDIHKHQFLAQRKDHTGKLKPYMAYPGSLIQQNFGESEKKGYLVWDIRSENDWNVEFHQLQNVQPFVTIPWKGTVNATIDNVKDRRGERAFLEGTRFRVSASATIPSVEARKLIHSLRETHKASEVVFKYDTMSRLDHISTNDLKISKKSLRQDPDAIVRLYLEYITANISNYYFDRESLDNADQLIRSYVTKLMIRESDRIGKSPNWSIKVLEFDNLFKYGEGNRIDFTNLDGIVGIFGPNKIGKSSIVGAIMYVLYNTTDRGPMKNAHIINGRKNYCKGMIRLNVGGVDYIIERQSIRVVPKRKTSKYNPHKTTTTLNFYRVEWDEALGVEKRVVLNSVTRDDTDKEIRELIGTSNDFLLTALSSQGSVDKFIKEGPTERKKILARFLELDIFEKLYALCKEDHNAISNRGALLSPESIINKIRKVRKKIFQGESEIKVLDERLLKAREHKDNVQLWLMHHEKNAADVDLAELDKLQKKIEITETSVIKKQEELDAVRTKITDAERKLKKARSAKAKIDVDDLKNQLNEFELLKTTLHEIKHELAAQKSILKNQKKNAKKLDIVPCDEQFPKCHYIRDGHRDKKKISTQEKLTTKLSEQFAINEKTLDEYVSRRIREKIAHHQTLDRQVFDSVRTAESGKKHREFLKTEIRNLKIDAKKFKSELCQKKRRVNVLEGKEYENKNEQLHRAKMSILGVEEKRHAALVDLGGKKESLKNWLLEEEETKTLIEKLKIYDSVLAAFSKTGIPAMVLKSQLPTINDELAKILEGIVDFKIGLETDIKSNTMDIYIQDEHSQRIIELASGMEKTIASMALRVAMINLSSLPKPDVFIIDEGYGALDSNNLQAVICLMQNFKTYFKTILTISHIPGIKECADILIDIESDGLESKIYWPPKRKKCK